MPGLLLPQICIHSEEMNLAQSRNLWYSMSLGKDKGKSTNNVPARIVSATKAQPTVTKTPS